MKVTQEKLPASRLKLEIEISGETSQKSYDKALQKLARTANIPGFRRGKVPKQVLLQRLGTNRIKASVIEELLEESVKEAIAQEKIEALGNYELLTKFDELISRFKPGQPLVFTTTVDVSPEIALESYTEHKVQAEEVLYSPEDLEKFLEEKRAERATLIPVEGRNSQPGDIAIVDYEAFNEKGEPLDDVGGKDLQVELASGRFIPGFTDAIVGMAIGETKEFPLTFPEDYFEEGLAGQSVSFKVIVNELKEKELPELDDDFAEEASEFETLEELKASLEEQFRERAIKQTETNIENALTERLVSLDETELPQTLINQEVDEYVMQTAAQMEQMGINLRDFLTQEVVEGMRERSRDDAIASLRRSLILAEIAQKEQIEPEPEAVKEKLAEYRKDFPDQKVNWAKLEQVIRKQLLEELTIAWLRERNQVELVPAGTLEKADASPTQVEAADETASVANVGAVVEAE